MDFRKVNWWRWQLPELAGKPLPLVYGDVVGHVALKSGRWISRPLDERPRLAYDSGPIRVGETLAGLPKVDRESVKALIAEAKAETAAVIEALEKVRKELAALKRAA